ncbi:hypothetical protein KJ618_04075 [Patescibacteria group bacterium]|nr:hypothetical protein [Patescibacteria group bacterium]
MTKIQKLKIILLAVFTLFLFVTPVFAAEVSVDLASQTIGVDKQFEAGFFLNTENEDINAVEGTIIFPQELLELKEIRDGNSIIAFWIERPKAVSGNEIRFSGIIPGGYADKRGFILSLVFQARQEGSSIIEICDIRALRNDGEGTEARTTVSNLQFVVSGASGTPKIPTVKKDIELPEPFEPTVACDPEMFEGKYFLVFATQDKGSGIDHYEVCEGKRKCIIAESPYLLKNQNLDEEIIVKAIDKSGNERIIALPAQKPAVWYKNYLILAIIILVIAIAYLIWKFLWRKHKR